MKKKIKFSKQNKVVSVIDYRDKFTLGDLEKPVARDLVDMMDKIDKVEAKKDEELLADVTEEYLSYEKKRWDGKYLTLISLITSSFIGISTFLSMHEGLGTLILSVPIDVALIKTTISSFAGRITAEQGLKKLKEVVSELKKEKNENKTLS